MTPSLRETRDRYCALDPEREPPDPDLVAVFDALDSALMLAAMWEVDPSVTARLRGSKLRWTISRHVDLP
jgi:hypothetical protein